MNQDHSTRGSLDEQLAALARDVAPPRDLWPDVQSAIRRAPARRWPLALAAGVAVATLAGLAGWQAGRRFVPMTALAVPAAAPSPDADLALPQGHGYAAVRTLLEANYRDRLAQLDTKTRLRVEHDLATIRAANADIRRALAADPQSPVLNRLLAGIWQQEFDFYVAVARNTESATQESGT